MSTRFVKSNFLRYCLSYLIVMILPVTAIAASFNTRFLADYRQMLTSRLQMTAEKTMKDLERQLAQMNLISMQFSFSGEFEAANLKDDVLIYRDVREQLVHYRYISNYVSDIVYLNCGFDGAYYTSLGTYNPAYFNQYRVNDAARPAADYLRGHRRGFFIPADDVVKYAPAFKDTVQYAVPVINADEGFLIFCIPVERMLSMLSLDKAQLDICAVLGDDGGVLYQAEGEDVPDWRAALDSAASDADEAVPDEMAQDVSADEADAVSRLKRMPDGHYIISTRSDALGLECVYSIYEHDMLAKVDSLTNQFLWLLILMLIVGGVLAVVFARLLARPIDMLIETVGRMSGGEPSGISDVRDALENVHRENMQLHSRYIESERRNVLMRLMSGQYGDREELEEDCMSVELPVTGCVYTVVLIDELRMPTSETANEIGRLFGDGMQVFGFRFRERQCQVFLLAEQDKGHRERAELFERIKGRYPGVMMAMGGQTQDIMHVQSAYQDCVFARRRAQMKGENAPVMSDSAHTQEGQAIYPRQELDALYNILKQKDVEKLSFIQDTLMFSLRALGDDPIYQQALCYDIISTYNLAMAKLGIGGRSDSQPFRTIDRGSMHIDRLLEMINDLYTEALDAFIAEEVPAQGNDISDIIAYIDSLHENIPNACELAERFGVSPSNLSHQFKRATGDTLASYIAERKMAIARQLLVETDMDVAQIGEKLGYTHPSSFIRMFHRVQGMTPAQYRDENSAKDE